MSKRHVIVFLFLIVFLAAIGFPKKDKIKKSSEGDILVGRNVNMVSGTTIPDGDPYLQRQNEPSIAVSSRNPMHLLAGANDYRTINYLFDDEIPGLEEKREQTNVPDAWLGVFKSFDGGQSWISTLIPGFPQDYSPEGMASPFKQGDWELIPTYAGADAVVRAGTNGLFYYSGIAFNRNQTRSVVFVSRFIDNNDMEGLDIEGKPRDSIKHIDTKIIAGVSGDDFIDKSWIGVGLPQNAGTTMIDGQEVHLNNVYLAYTVFSGSGENLESEIMFRRSTDNGKTWTDPMPIDVENAGLQSKDKGKGKGKGKGEGEGVNQGAVIAVDPREEYGNVYVAWRQFGDGKKSDAIFITKSENWGASFGEPVQVSQKMIPFEQGTSTYSFRTNAYPTLTVDDMGIVYIAWAQRIGVKKTNIVISTSSDGKKWSPARKAERGFGEDDSEKDSGDNIKGHQFQPSLTFAQGKLMMVWYDQRDDLAQEALGNKAFKEYIEDSLVRHTVDVRAAQADPGLNPIFGLSQRVSRYLHIIDTDGVAKQVEFNPPNYTLFKTGTVPFHGDYIDIASQSFVSDQSGGWTYNTQRSESTVFHTTWVDNRDVRPPGGNWWVFPWPTSNYNAPASESNPLNCTDGDLTGTRNQNIYTATLTSGVITGAYGNTKHFSDETDERTFIIYLKNTTSEVKSFRLTINSSQASASFRKDRSEGDLLELDVEIPPYSTVTRTVFVEHAVALFPLIRIDVVEIDAPDGSPIPGGHTDYILLNPDPSNPLIKDYWAPELPLQDEYHTPRVKNPRVKNYVLSEEDPEEDPDRLNPATLNPRVKNLGIENPGELNTRIINPRVKNEGVVNPRVKNTNFVNYEMENPRVKNPRVKNTAMADVVWDVTNEGNTTSTYTLDMLSNAASGEEIPDPEIITQILVFKQHTAPVDRGCVLAEERQDQLLLNITNPRVKNPSEWNPRVKNETIENPRVKNATFALAPGETAHVVFRIWDDNTGNDSSNNTSGGLRALNNGIGGLSIDDIIGEIIGEEPQGVGAAMSAHAPDTGEDEPTVAISEVVAPEIGYSSNPSPLNFTAPYGDETPLTGTLSIGAVQGVLDYTLSIVFNSGDSWLAVDPAFGVHTAGDPAILHDVTVNPSGLSAGTYVANIVIEAAGASNSPTNVPVTLTITSAQPGPLDHFDIDTISNQTSGTAFSITITAKDSGESTVTSYTGPNTLSDTTGTINPISTGAFVNGAWTGNITITNVQTGVTISTSGYTKNGTSNSFDVISGLPQDDASEENDDFGSATLITAGTYANLQLLDDDWYKIYVDAGMYLKVTITGDSENDIDLGLADSSGKFLVGGISSSNTETIYYNTPSAGDYYIRVPYTWGGALQNTYTLMAEVSASFGLGHVFGTVTDTSGTTPLHVRVRVIDEYGFHRWNTLTDVSTGGAYKISIPPGRYNIRFMTYPILDYYGGINYLNEYYSEYPYDAYPYSMASLVEVLAGGNLSNIDGHLEPGGTISGTVTAQGLPIDGALVRIRDLHGYSIGSANSDASGQYTIVRLHPGYYKAFVRSLTENHGIEWYNDKSSFDEANAFYVDSSQPAQGIDFQLTEGGSVAGRVTDVNGGVEGIRVIAYDPSQTIPFLYPSAQIPQISLLGTWTNGNGDYVLDHLPPGDVKIYFNTPNTHHVPEWYDNNPDFEDSDAVTIQAGLTTSNIDAELVEGGSIGGRVTDSSGDGIKDVLVWIFNINGWGYYQKYVYTDDEGYYYVDGVPVGNIKVRFRPNISTSPPENWAVEWYNDKNSYTEADEVTVVSNQTTWNIDAVLADNGGRIEGRVENSNGQGIGGVQVVAYDSTIQAQISFAYTDANGYYSVPRIPTCFVKLAFSTDDNKLPYLSEFYNDSPSYAGAEPVSVVLGQTTTLLLDVVLSDRTNLSVTSTSLPNGDVGTPYSQALVAEGGTKHYHWSLAQGSNPLPNGIVLHGTGLIDGIPTTTGTYNFTVQVVDYSYPPQSDTQNLSITITPTIDAIAPDTASVTTPANGASYNAASVPTTFSGQVGDDANGAGMNANSATFYIADTTDTKYWDGDSWEDAVTWLATTHNATTDGSDVTWDDDIALPAWTDGHGYEVKAKATDKASNAFEGPAITFTVIVAPTTATISGTVMYNGEAIAPKYTDKTVNFWARDEMNPSQAFPISPTYNNTTGIYSIPNVPPSTYGIRVYVDDAEPLDGKNFPGDYWGWNTPIEVEQGDTVVNVDLVCQKIMHLTAPINNLNEQHWAGPDYDTWQSPITFDWDAIGEASTYYKYRVAKYQSNPYQYIEEVVTTTETTNTQTDITLPVSSVNQHFQFDLYAYNTNDVMIGQFMIVYTSGHGWDYRFRVIKGSSAANSMGSPRAHHRATKLKDGRVMITGGQGSSYHKSAEIYNPCSGNFAYTAAAMNFEHSEHTATLLSDGKVLIVGGYGTESFKAEIYDPGNNSFSPTVDAPSYRTQHTATLLEGHKVLIVGGFDAGTTAEIFDPGTDPSSGTFTQITGPDRYHHTATLLKDGNVLIVGGRDGNNVPLKSALIYVPASGFSVVGDMSVARHNHTATLLPDGKVLIAGGTNWDGSQGGSLNTAEIFDPGTGTFETLITMVRTRAAHTATLMDDGTVLLTGGDSQGTVEIYYPSTGRFRSAGSMTTLRSEHTATILPDGTVLITGGNPGSELNSAEIFYPIALTTYLYGVNSIDNGLSIIDPDSGQVTFIGPLDTDPDTFTTPIAMAVRPTDGKIFVWNNSDPAGVLLTVDPCTGLATKVNPLAPDQGTQHALAFASDGKLFGVSSTLLYEIDTISGVKSFIGNLNVGSRTAAFGADFDANGVLYAITFDYDNPSAFKKLITIDTSTGQGSIVGQLNVDIGTPGSIVFDATGKLIGSGSDGPEGQILFDINPADGTVSNIRTLSGGTTPQGMGFAPRKKLY